MLKMEEMAFPGFKFQPPYSCLVCRPHTWPSQLTQLRFKNVVETLDLSYMNVLGQRCDNENL
jgi:hypothetical protein